MQHDPQELARFLDGMSLDGPVDPFLVFADWLQSQGDPWGELMAVGCAAAVEPEGPRAEALNAEHARLLRAHGKDICFILGEEHRSITWRRGFVARVRIAFSRGPTALESELTRLLELPAMALLTELDFRDSTMVDAEARVLLQMKARIARVATLRLDDNRLTADAARELGAAFPAASLQGQKQPLALVRAQREEGHRAFIRAQGGPRSIDDIED